MALLTISLVIVCREVEGPLLVDGPEGEAREVEAPLLVDGPAEGREIFYFLVFLEQAVPKNN